jgi:hypothetical protein
MLDKYEQFSIEDVHMDHVLRPSHLCSAIGRGAVAFERVHQRGDGITEGSVLRNALTEDVARS